MCYKIWAYYLTFTSSPLLGSQIVCGTLNGGGRFSFNTAITFQSPISPRPGNHGFQNDFRESRQIFAFYCLKTDAATFSKALILFNLPFPLCFPWQCWLSNFRLGFFGTLFFSCSLRSERLEAKKLTLLVLPFADGFADIEFKAPIVKWRLLLSWVVKEEQGDRLVSNTLWNAGNFF